MLSSLVKSKHISGIFKVHKKSQRYPIDSGQVLFQSISPVKVRSHLTVYTMWFLTRVLLVFLYGKMIKNTEFLTV